MKFLSSLINILTLIRLNNNLFIDNDFNNNKIKINKYIDSFFF